MNHNGRPLTMRKKVQLLLALTILAWATQTLFAQWSHGAEAFVARDAQAPARGGTLELRGEARVFGAEVKLKQVCRWSDADAATFAPLADVVIVKLDARRPFRNFNLQRREALLHGGLRPLAGGLQARHRGRELRPAGRWGHGGALLLMDGRTTGPP